MSSKLVLNHQRTAASVSAAVDTHGPHVAQALTERLKPLLKSGESMPDLGLVIQLFDRLSRQDLDALTASEQRLASERLEDADARAARDTAQSALYALMRDLSEEVAFIFGTDQRPKVHLGGSTPTDPLLLASAALQCADALAAGALQNPRRPLPFDAAAHAQALRDAAARMQREYRAVHDDARETEAALLQRDAAASTYNVTFTRSASVFEHLCDLAGAHDLSRRIRRAANKPGTTVEDPSSDPSAKPTPT